jgi:L-amino acid N-acyltransferase YncA
MDIRIRPLKQTDWNEVRRIYAEGISTGLATFETEVPTWSEWDKSHIKSCRLVAVDVQNQIVGWAALSTVTGRCAYQGVAEVSIYISAEGRGQGVGKQLLQTLIGLSEDDGYWMLQSGILAENLASIQLHQTCGFRMVGYREKIGKLNEVWRDTVLMERRSHLVEYPDM